VTEDESLNWQNVSSGAYKNTYQITLLKQENAKSVDYMSMREKIKFYLNKSQMARGDESRRIKEEPVQEQAVLDTSKHCKLVIVSKLLEEPKKEELIGINYRRVNPKGC
jgi:hypothetical protein